MEKFSHIPDEEIKQDILDTQNEIDKMERECKGFELLGDKMSMFRRDVRIDGIKERKEFIAKLENILTERSNGGFL